MKKTRHLSFYLLRSTPDWNLSALHCYIMYGEKVR